MEALAPSLRLVQCVRYAVESGESVRHGLREYMAAEPDSFAPQVAAWMQLIERGLCTRDFMRQIKIPARRNLLGLLERGLRGEPILAALSLLDEEIQEQSFLQIEGFLSRLPFRMMLPLLFFLFPAFVMLLLGPLMMRIVEGMG